jgi:hypothetical protein
MTRRSRWLGRGAWSAIAVALLFGHPAHAETGDRAAPTRVERVTGDWTTPDVVAERLRSDRLDRGVERDKRPDGVGHEDPCLRHAPATTSSADGGAPYLHRARPFRRLAVRGPPVIG